MTLRESDIIPGRHYLCRVWDASEERTLMPLRVSDNGKRWLGECLNVGIRDEAVEVLRELDLEALAANREAQQLADLRVLDAASREHLGSVLGRLYAAQERASRAIAAAESGDADADDLLAALQDIADGADPPPRDERPAPDVIDWTKDVREEVYRSTNAVNQAACGVRLVHMPTGISATVAVHRSQHKNRTEARRSLASRVAARLRETEGEDATR